MRTDYWITRRAHRQGRDRRAARETVLPPRASPIKRPNRKRKPHEAHASRSPRHASCHAQAHASRTLSHTAAHHRSRCAASEHRTTLTRRQAWCTRTCHQNHGHVSTSRTCSRTCSPTSRHVRRLIRVDSSRLIRPKIQHSSSRCAPYALSYASESHLRSRSSGQAHYAAQSQSRGQSCTA